MAINYTKKIRQTVAKISGLRRRKYWKKIIKDRNSSQVGDLSQTERSAIIKFFKKYERVDTSFHKFYKYSTGQFYKNYIPDDLYYCKIDPYYNDWELAEYLDNKCYYSTIFQDVNQPKMIASRMNNFWFIDGEIVSLDYVLDKIKGKEVFIKQATNSEGGFGVFFVSADMDKQKVEKIISKIDTDIVIQESLVQSITMSKLNKTSVNTVRILSFLDKNGKVKIYSSIVRMGVDNSKVDNASSGGITCGICKNGQLKSVAYAANGKKYNVHPNTNLHFDTIIIPNYNELLKIVEKLHTRLPHFRLLSWDFAIDIEDKPVLIEVNLRYGELDFHQLNNGPVFGNDTKKILDEVFCKGARKNGKN